MHTPPSGLSGKSSLDARLKGIIKCLSCPQTFETVGKHNWHARTHSKPYRCDKCSRGFALRSDLSRHKDWHEKELRPKYKCGWSDCSFKTFRKDHLKRHLLKAHQEVGGQLMQQDCMPINLSFMLAVREKRSNAAKVLLEHGADVTAKPATGKTALHFAAMNNDYDLTLTLIHAGTDCSTRDGTREKRSALDIPADSGYEAIVRLLLEALDPRMAVCQNNEKCLNDPVPSNQIVLSQRREKMLASLKRTALERASDKGHSAIFELLLSLGADPNQGNSLQLASQHGHFATVALLLRSGADPNLGTPLGVASREGHLAIAELLLRSGENPNSPSYPYGSAIVAASQLMHFEIVQLLLNSGADPNVQSGSAITPLESASSKGQFEIVKLLLNLGAKIRVICGYYPNAAQRAFKRGHSKIVDLLLASTLSHADRVALVDSLSPEKLERLSPMYF